MASLSVFPIVIIIFISGFLTQTKEVDGNFDGYYNKLWGGDHFQVDPKGTNVQLIMDRSSGAGFRSKLEYGSGLFHIRMKIPEKKTGGIVTTFYLTSAPDNNQDPGNHFEIDYEFVGTNGTVQTNVYNNDRGNREQSFKLWFDPSKNFHTYEFLWNPHQIVFFIDKIPIRVFKNNTARGIAYPWLAMHVEGSIWNANWAGSVDWSQAPFIAHYQDFDFRACSTPTQNIAGCASSVYSWNNPKFWGLNAIQRRLMKMFRKLYMTYDYCAQRSTWKPDCLLNR